MSLQNIILVLLVLIIIIDIIINIIKINKIDTSFLSGYWESSLPDCELNGVDKMAITIDLDEKILNVIIMIDGEISTNEDFDLQIFSINQKNNLIDLYMTLNNDSEFEWNGKKIKCLINIDKGIMELFDNNILLGKFYKDNIITNLLF